jgi:FMN phosphatase YigB (HAD superfamily)
VIPLSGAATHASARAQDIRVSDVEAVLFDYGRTLVTFDYPAAELSAVVERFRPAIAAATGTAAPPAAEIMERVLLPLEALVENPALDEVRYMDFFAPAWRRAGLDLPEELLYEILDAEQLVWDGAARVDPVGLDVLSWLGAHGCKRAVCSNAPFPPEMMLRQVAGNGVAERVDGIVFSSQVGRRKPAPEAYLAALETVGVDAAHALFVGDRVREDYDGPRAVGMRALICTAHLGESPGDGIPTIASLSELRSLV